MNNIHRIASPATMAFYAEEGKWIPAKHLMYIDQHITDLVLRRIPERILCIEAPPRHGKSELVSHHTPAWFLGNWPDKRVMLASYADKFASKWGRAARDVLKKIGPEYFDVRVSRETMAASHWDLVGRKGGMVTSGKGGTFTGLGADLLILDDLIKNAEEATSETVREGIWEWFQSTAWTRMEPGGVCIVMMTRWHEDDLIGKLLKWGEDSEVGVAHISLPAIAGEDCPLGRKPGDALWPERLPLEELNIRKDLLEPYWWEAMFQQRPGTYGKNTWPAEYFQGIFVDEMEWPDKFESSVICWDPSLGAESKKGDFSPLVFLGLTRGLLWVDCQMQREDPYRVACRLASWGNATNPDKVGVESNTFQRLLEPIIDQACQDMGVPPLPLALVNNNTKKTLRISRLGGYLARKKFRFRSTPGAKALVKQLRGFPFAEHDDGPDALEQAQRLLRFAVNDEKIPEEIMRV